MPTTADIVIIGPLPKRERIAVVSVFNRVGLSPEDGNDRLGYMRVTGGPASYFVMVSQDIGYIWEHGSDLPKSFQMQSVVKRFLPNLRSNDRLYGFQVEMLVTHWLFELVAGWRDSGEEPEKTLASVGFLAAVQGASVHSEAVA